MKNNKEFMEIYTAKKEPKEMELEFKNAQEK